MRQIQKLPRLIPVAIKSGFNPNNFPNFNLSLWNWPICLFPFRNHYVRAWFSDICSSILWNLPQLIWEIGHKLHGCSSDSEDATSPLWLRFYFWHKWSRNGSVYDFKTCDLLSYYKRLQNISKPLKLVLLEPIG